VHTGTLEQSLILQGILPGPAEMTIVEVLEELLSESEDRENLARHMQSIAGLLMELEEVDLRLDALLEQLDAELGD